MLLLLIVDVVVVDFVVVIVVGVVDPRNLPLKLSQPQLQHSLNTVVVLDPKMTVQTPPHPPTETLLQPSGASD